jgi:hypothetical protein
MNGKMVRSTTIAVAVAAGAILSAGTAFAREGSDHNHDNDGDISYKRSYDHPHQGGDGANGGRNRAECAIPLGVSLGGVASSGGPITQCNARGGNGGNGGAGDVDYDDD